MNRVVKGKLIPVENKERKLGSALLYIAVQVENEDGKGECCLLFTQAAVAEARERANKNPEDLTKKGFWTNIFD